MRVQSLLRAFGIVGEIGGQVPVQGDFEMPGWRWGYFRARGQRWTFEVYRRRPVREASGTYEPLPPHSALEWSYGEPWPGGEFAAGWMDWDAAMLCVLQAVRAWVARDLRVVYLVEDWEIGDGSMITSVLTDESVALADWTREQNERKAREQRGERRSMFGRDVHRWFIRDGAFVRDGAWPP